MFEVGDKVVYPHHGAGTVLAKEFHAASAGST
jgi:RNA polymerase-interacting CarD/CdnL/TRCF family regulator